MAKKYVMALDQGTTSSRCIIFDETGRICSMAQKEFNQIYPKAGWVEHDPLEIWSSQISVLSEAMSKIKCTADEIAAIGITNQRETTIVWDKETGKPVYNAIVWQCRRTADIIDKLNEDGLGDVVRAKTGLIPDAYFSATKIKWILENVEGAREKAESGQLLFGTVDTWLMYNLTEGKVFATDYTNASRTMLYNIEKLDWDDEILEYFNIPRCMLPDVKPSSGIFGYSSEKLTGGVAIPIAGVAGDQQAALFGQCCFEPGDVKNTYGTGCFMLMNTGKKLVRSGNGLLTTIAVGADGNVAYALEGSVFVAGAAIQWLRDELQMIRNSAETEEIAMKVPDTNGVYVVPAFAGLGAPYWNQHARGIITGLTRGAGRGHIVRATLESIAYQVNDLLTAMEQDSHIDLTSLKVDGGASVNNFLMQFQADILDAAVRRPKVVETTGLGAAFLAGIAVGVWKSAEELKAIWSLEREFEPNMTAYCRKNLIEGWKEAIKLLVQN